METLEVHSKDFLVKWINAPENSVIDWQVKPLKKSINFAIYKKNESLLSTPLLDDLQPPPPLGGAASEPPTPASDPKQRLRSASVVSVNEVSDNVSSIYKTLSRSNTKSSGFSSNLNNSDLTLVKDYKKLISGELVHGKFVVKQGGIYAFIFDNSFSKSFGKKILFSSKIIPGRREGAIREEPSSASSSRAGTPGPPVRQTQPNGTSAPSSTPASSIHPASGNTTPRGGATAANGATTPNGQGNIIERPKNGELLQGILLKRRRKKLQGFTKRFFVLNFKYGTLSYFKVNDNKLRGQMPIKYSIVSANLKNREIIIDSGMEAWDLKCQSAEIFKSWVQAFNQIKSSHYGASADIENSAELYAITGISGSDGATTGGSNTYVLNSLEKISDKVATLKQEVTKLSSKGIVNHIENEIDLLVHYLQGLNGLQRGTPEQEANNALYKVQRNDDDDDIKSALSADFFDAEEYLDASNSGVLFVNGVDSSNKTDHLVYLSKSKRHSDDEDVLDVQSNSSEELELDIPLPSVSKDVIGEDLDQNLYPLPIEKAVKRDYDIPLCDHEPPSVLAFLRKNVGKDLSSIAMPVTMNEPLSTLQKYSELMEYCELIDNAIQANCEDATGERILRIAAFAVSSLSSMRSKERNVRKPFTPLLGESFELVREDLGFRMVSEKVFHRPPVYALFIESNDWEFNFSPSPEQKFWGKNAEIITRGVAKLTIKATGEVFLWSQPLTLLKGIIAGEKYGEPSTSLVVKSSFGFKAVVEFSKGGMFSGRQEDLKIAAFRTSNDKKPLPYSVFGKWTESLTLKTNTTERLIWTVGELIPNPGKKFGFTKFAGTLNKITEIEKDLIPRTDSRLRPDLKLYENGKVDEAEALKIKLEEDQRVRRKELEAAEKVHEPKFFTQVSESNDTEWVYIKGEKSYWNRRRTGDWDDLLELW